MEDRKDRKSLDQLISLDPELATTLEGIGQTLEAIQNSIDLPGLGELAATFTIPEPANSLPGNRYLLSPPDSIPTGPSLLALMNDRLEKLETLLRSQAEPAADRSQAEKYENAVAYNIDRLRKECGWTFDDLARRTGLEKTTIIHHVHDGARPRPATLKIYTQAFSKELKRDVSVTELERW